MDEEVVQIVEELVERVSEWPPDCAFGHVYRLVKSLRWDEVHLVETPRYGTVTITIIDRDARLSILYRLAEEVLEQEPEEEPWEYCDSDWPSDDACSLVFRCRIPIFASLSHPVEASVADSYITCIRYSRAFRSPDSLCAKLPLIEIRL